MDKQISELESTIDVDLDEFFDDQAKSAQMTYRPLSLMKRSSMTSESLSSRTLWLAQGSPGHLLDLYPRVVGGGSKDASQTETADVKEPTFDPSALPAALRRRLGEAETRIKA